MKERIIRAVAGSLVLVALTLAMLVNIHWLWLAVFVGANLLQSSVTRFCPLEKILEAAGVDRPAKRLTAQGLRAKPQRR